MVLFGRDMDSSADRIPDGSLSAAHTTNRRSLTRAVKDEIYGLFIRGLTLDTIAAQVGIDFQTVGKVVADRSSVEGSGDEQNPDRKNSGDALRALKRVLWAAMQTAENKAGYGSVLNSIEQRILKIDGRCGAKKKNGPGFCTKYPVDGRARCREHGGASLEAGPGHPRWKTGVYSKAKVVPITPEEQKLVAEFENEGTNISHQIAMQKLVQRRAILMGDTTAASGAGAALASMIRAQRDAGRPPVDLEAALQRAATVFVERVMRHVTDPAQIAAILRDLSTIEWKEVVVPSLPETTPALAERE